MTDQRPLGFWLKLVDRLIDDRFADTLEEHGVTRRQWQLLNVLSRGPATGAQLDAALAPFLSAVDGETVAEHLAELVDSGWVALSPSGYSLADPGRTALAALASTVEKTRAASPKSGTPRLSRHSSGWRETSGGRIRSPLLLLLPPIRWPSVRLRRINIGHCIYKSYPI
jgi:hypothetical protein